MTDISAMPMAMMANGKAKMAEWVAASSDSTPALPRRSGWASAGSPAMSAGVTTKATVTKPATRQATTKPKRTRSSVIIGLLARIMPQQAYRP